MDRRNAGIAIFFVSASMLLFEITLTRLFSILMWYHFVSFSVALALGGMAAGALLSLPVKKEGGAISPASLSGFLLFSSFSILILYALFVALSLFPAFGYRVLSPLHQVYYEPFGPSGGGGGKGFFSVVVLIIFFCALPFVGGGAVYALSFQVGGNDRKIYCYSMLGSATGVLIYLFVMRLGSGPLALITASFLFLLPIVLGGKERRVKGRVFLVLLFFFLSLAAVDLVSSPADPAFARGRYMPDILWSRWDAVSRVAVYPLAGDELLRGFGEGKMYRGEAPESRGMVVDDTGYTTIFGLGKGGDWGEFFRYNLAALPYLLKHEGRALIIGPGGGKDINCALSSGRFSIDAVEVNSLVVTAVQDRFGDFSGRPYTLEKVNYIHNEGRAFVEGEKGKYDIIQMTQVFGRVSPQAGAFTLTENHLYTLEAFRAMLSKLRKGGILSITRFAFEKTGPRLVNTLREALKTTGEKDPGRSLLIAGSRGVMNVMVVKGGAKGESVENFRRECEEKGFDVLYAPDSGKEFGHKIIPLIALKGADDVSVNFDLSPPTDDRPFFYYTLYPEEFFRGKFGERSSTEERGAGLVRNFLSRSLVLSFTLPFIFALFPGRKNLFRRLAIFFACLVCGAGFIFVEVILIKKLILLLGFPALSLSCILLSILLFAGTGSLLSTSLDIQPEKVAIISSLFLAAILLIYKSHLGGITFSISGMPFFFRYAGAFVICAIPSFFMGMPFPALLEVYNRDYGGDRAPPIALNGLASVSGSMLALSLSMNLGYGTSLSVAGVIYVLVALLSFLA